VSRTLEDEGFRLGNVSVAPPPIALADDTPPATTSTATAPPTVAPTPPEQPTPASIIVSQAPAAGQKVLAGTAVSFEVR
jgi:hypothetical protein